MQCAQGEKEVIYGDMPNDELCKVKHQQIGYDYNLGQFQVNTADFEESDLGKLLKSKHPEQFEVIRNKVKNGQNISDHSVMAKVLKLK